MDGSKRREWNTGDTHTMTTERITINDLSNESRENDLSKSIEITQPPSLRVVPPLNFSPVERYLYRSGQPSTINHSFLQELNLKSVIWLAIEEPQDTFLKFIEDNEINFFYNLGYDNIDSNSWDGLSESSIKQSLEIISDKRNHPLLVCCGMGRHRTGTVIGCLRKLQGWNLASVGEEYRRFTGIRGGRILVELLIEAFDINSIKIDKDIAPDWLLR